MNDETEEISLDDFFSDEQADGEISLDAFMDGGEAQSADSAPVPEREDDIPDAEPLEMDIHFDSSADSVEQVDNISLSDDLFSESAGSDTATSFETEEISMDFFSDDAPVTPPASSKTPSAPPSEITTEEIDLSDFGIDSTAEETPIVQDVEESKHKEKIIDYDLSVGDEGATATPVVNELKKDDSAKARSVWDEVSQLHSHLTRLRTQVAVLRPSRAKGAAETLQNVQGIVDELFSVLAVLEAKTGKPA